MEKEYKESPKRTAIRKRATNKNIQIKYTTIGGIYQWII